MKNLVTGLMVALFVLFVSYAGAQKMYVGVGGGFAWDAFDQDELFTGAGLDPEELDGSWAAYVFFGYGINDNIAVQADFGYFFGFQPEAFGDVDLLEDIDLTIWTLMGSVKYSFTPGAKWSPYVIGGVGWGQLDSEEEFLIPSSDEDDPSPEDSQSGMVARVGGGVDYKINEKMSVFADVGYVFTFGDIEDWNFIDVRAGLTYSFQ